MNKFLLFLGVAVILVVGSFLFGRLLSSENITTNYSCHDIAHFHADLLIREYGIEFNTDVTNPNRDINQRASDLNAQLLTICRTNPVQ